MIAIQNLNFAYRHSLFGLSIADLAINTGESTAIVGPSGSGKTTLLHLMAGILRPMTGRIQIDGVNVAGLTDAARRNFRLQKIGLVFQNFELIEYLNVLDNVLLPCRLGPPLLSPDNARRRAHELLERAGMQVHLQKSVTRLSQGERQRVAICRALLIQPTLLLADEPTGNLDPQTSGSIMDLLIAAGRRPDSTLVMVTHDHALLPRFDRVLDFSQFLSGTELAAPLPGASS